MRKLHAKEAFQVYTKYRIFFIEDSSEATINTIHYTTARSSCKDKCSSPNVFYGIRRDMDNQFKCKCFERGMTDLIAEVNGGHNPIYHVNCAPIIQPHRTSFEDDTSLTEFLEVSTVSFKTSLGQDNDTQLRPNVCNPSRVVNIATLYLAKLLGVNLDTIITTFTYVHNKVYVFPNNDENPITTYPPQNLPNFPNLEQAYWTILSYFTPLTEPQIRNNKSPLWCWYVGRAVWDHCTNTQRNKCSVDICPDVWKYFLEGCHRLRSINPVGIYAYSTNPNRWCAGQNARNIYEISRRFLLKVVFKKHFVIHIQMVLDLS